MSKIETIGDLLALQVEGKTYDFDHTAVGTITKCDTKTASNGKKYVNIKIKDNTGKIKLQIWEDNDNYAVIKGIDEDERVGTRIRVENVYVKQGYTGYNANPPNEIALQWKGERLGKIIVIGKGDPEDDIESLDEAIANAGGKDTKKKKTSSSPKKSNPGSGSGSGNGGECKGEEVVQKLDEVIEAINNIPLAIGNLDKNLQRKLDENNTMLMQQFKEFMSKFIESSEVTPEDLGDEPPPEEG